MGRNFLLLNLIVLAMCKVKVFIILHSHCDAGWLKTADQYYQNSTKSILETIIKLLNEDPELKFSWSEISFLARYLEEFPEQKKQLINLIQKGQIEIVGGGWAQHDEALPDFDLILRQMQAGFTYIRENLNVTKVKVGWQLDPFGHSSLTAALLNKMGFESLVFSRIEDNHRVIIKQKYLELGVNSEFIWKPEGFGEKLGILTHVLNDHYYPPPALDRVPWNSFRCFGSLPAQEYEIQNCVQSLEAYVERAQKKYRTNNHFMIVGGDFFYSDLEDTRLFFGLLKDIKNSTKNVDMVFATASEYFDAVYKENKKFSVFKGDLLPLISTGYGFFKSWNGYYTSKPLIKKTIIETQRYVRSAEILSSVVLNSRFTSYNLALSTHHDAITGTCKSFVFLDYLSLLSKDVNHAIDIISQSFRALSIKSQNNNQLEFPFRVLYVFNSLGWKTEKLQFFESKSRYIRVFTSKGRILMSQMIPWGKVNRFYFIIPVKPYTLHTYFIRETDIIDPNENENEYSQESQIVLNDTLKNPTIEIKLKNGLIFSIKNKNFEYLCDTKLISYSTYYSGAYTFTPIDEKDISHNINDYIIYSGNILQIAKSGYRYNDSFFDQTIILPNHLDTFYLKIKLNPPDNSDIYLRFKKPFNKESWFYTFNTLNIMKKSYINLERFRPADNYYPISGSLWIDLIENFFFIIPGFPVGAGIVNNENFELNLHRSLQSDDGLGLDQNDLDTAEVEHEFKMGFNNLNYNYVWKSYLDHRNQPVVLQKKPKAGSVDPGADNNLKGGNKLLGFEIKVFDAHQCAHFAGFAKRQESYFANVINICNYTIKLPFKNSKLVQPGWLDFNPDQKRWMSGVEIEMKLHDNTGYNVIQYNFSLSKGKIASFELVGIEIDLEKEMNEIILEIPSQFLGEEAQVVYLIVLSVAIFLILIIILCFKSKKKIRYLE